MLEQTRAIAWLLFIVSRTLLIFSFGVAFGSALIANGIFGVPLYQIVDANFSVQLVIQAAGLLYLAYQAGKLFVAGQFAFFFLYVFLVLLSAAQNLVSGGAYLLYAKLDHVDLFTTSFVFVGYGKVLLTIAKILGFSVPAGSGLSQPIEWRQTVSDINSIGGLLTLAVTLFGIFAGRRRAQG
jgi:hypothetical protein